ncbi:hypothetical protein EI16_11370 [Hydrogenovibrio marinus]|uniref:Uncharacterized protein n=1 Tax=Hydrogenovibrio marinus TaxID=28885 RepID=A0A066ZX28_HYDMR|nr:hypothetical protein EI16_11370 [Hydrogenovibrio marinus]
MSFKLNIPFGFLRQNICFEFLLGRVGVKRIVMFTIGVLSSLASTQAISQTTQLTSGDKNKVYCNFTR